MQPPRAEVYLLEAAPRNAATGAAVVVRLAGGGIHPYRYFGQQWLAGLDRPPLEAQRLGFGDAGDGPGWSGAAPQAQAARLRWAGNGLAGIAGYYWKGAAVTLRAGPDGGIDGEFAIILTGRIDDARVDASGALVLDVVDATAALGVAVLDGVFAGSGGAEGGSQLKDRARRRAWGDVRNVELWPWDTGNNLWVGTDPNRPLQAISKVSDRGNPGIVGPTVAWAGSVDATRAALAAAVAPDGGYAMAPSIAAIKWWHPGPGLLTADLLGEIGAGYVDKAATIAERIVQARSTVAFAAGDIATWTAARAGTAGILIDDPGETVAQALVRLLGGVGLAWFVTAAGAIAIREYAWGSSVASMSGGLAERVRTYRPTKKRVVGYDQNHKVMNRGDIAAALFAADVGVEAGATRNVDPNNIVRNPVFADGTANWNDQSGLATFTFTADGTNPPAAKVVAYQTPPGNNGHTAFIGDSATANGGGAVPVSAGEKIWFEAWGARGNDANGSIRVFAEFWKADGAASATHFIEVIAFDATVCPSNGVYVRRTGSVTVPGDAAWMHAIVSPRSDWTTGLWQFAAPRVSRYELGATAGAPPGTSINGMPVEQAMLGSENDHRETFAGYADSAAMDRAWVTTGSAAGTRQFVAATSTPGGKYLEIGTSTGNGYAQIICSRLMPYSAEDLYEIALDIEFPEAGTGVIYVGVRGLDKDGNNVSGNGTFHYVAVSGGTITAGRRTYRGYFRGYGTTVASSDPANPSPLTAGVVNVSMMAIVRLADGTGRSRLHEFTLRKVEDVTTIWTGAWSSTRTYRYGEGVTSAEGHGFSSSQNNNLNHQPPPTFTTDSWWTAVVKKGDSGATGATGVSVRRIYQRSTTQPATPAPSAGTPSGWVDDPANATGSGPVWAVDGERAAGGANYTWTAAIRHEAISSSQTGQAVPLGFTVSSTLSFSLTAGQSRVVNGQGRLDAPVGSGTVYVQIESRVAGGSWSASNGASEAYAVGEPAVAAHQITITNAGGTTLSYEARGTIVRSNSNSGPLTTAESVLSI